MVQLPGSGKRHAGPPAVAGRVPGPAPAVKAEVEEVFGGRDGPPHKRVRTVPPPPPPQDMSCDVLDEPSPLGLRLRKSPSLLDLIQMKLSQAKSAGEQFPVHNSISDTTKKKDVKSGAPTANEKRKASNFNGNVLKIGNWEYISRYEGDLVAKCYFAKHKLVWEVLHDGLKSKIEIQWSDITALKATCPENEQEGALDLVLARPPFFFRETDPQPRKHTLWQAASDFTDGQASLNRRHTFQCSSSSLSKNFEKLIQCDQRLFELSQQLDAILETPNFEPRRSIFENPDDSKDCLGFNGFKYEREASLPKFNDPATPCAFSSPSKNIGQPINIGFQGRDVPQESKNYNQWNQLKVPGLRASISVEDLVNHLGNCIGEQRSAGDPLSANNEGKSKEVLEDLVQCLFSDTQGLADSDDKYLMARVNSLYSLLEIDTSPSTIPKPECRDGGHIGVIQLDSDGSDEELNSSPARNTAGGTEMPAISRKDSFGELLLNLPRIASIPQFLFNIPEDTDQHTRGF
ncbi:hypothetical protein BAE44_0008271 [Dichanthelium oligosanthes]|uniref:TRF2/HOY1 PH-like domain-containing protein n=1 Tax=Dichanthelium oligosanthes TaxID=888268 RepID=A0A1E5W067_9POAL|nr:hypothetical protein BAE44_0008271 [Dichanthelium oligosanthes]